MNNQDFINAVTSGSVLSEEAKADFVDITDVIGTTGDATMDEVLTDLLWLVIYDGKVLKRTGTVRSAPDISAGLKWLKDFVEQRGLGKVAREA